MNFFNEAKNQGVRNRTIYLREMRVRDEIRERMGRNPDL